MEGLVYGQVVTFALGSSRRALTGSRDSRVPEVGDNHPMYIEMKGLEE